MDAQQIEAAKRAARPMLHLRDHVFFERVTGPDGRTGCQVTYRPNPSSPTAHCSEWPVEFQVDLSPDDLENLLSFLFPGYELELTPIVVPDEDGGTPPVEFQA